MFYFHLSVSPLRIRNQQLQSEDKAAQRKSLRRSINTLRGLEQALKRHAQLGLPSHLDRLHGGQ